MKNTLLKGDLWKTLRFAKVSRKEAVLLSHFESIEQVVAELGQGRYVADRALATVLFLAHKLEKPIFLEGEPGVGKTEVAIVIAQLLFFAEA